MKIEIENLNLNINEGHKRELYITNGKYENIFLNYHCISDIFFL